MPELPEVETVCRQLAPILLGRRLVSVKIIDKKLQKFPKRSLLGRMVTDLTRHGKEILISFDESFYLTIHLRMTGRLIWRGDEELDSANALYHDQGRTEVDRSLRIRFLFDGGELLFCDVRRFGTIKFSTSVTPLTAIDPIADDLSVTTLGDLLNRSKQELKVWLLRQDRLVGIGNIYASEILFDARINPQRLANTLSVKEVRRLTKSIRKILQLAIDKAGTTFSDYRDVRGESGGFQSLLKVYNRKAEPCKRCKARIVKMVQSQRSTFYCPNCQG